MDARNMWNAPLCLYETKKIYNLISLSFYLDWNNTGDDITSTAASA